MRQIALILLVGLQFINSTSAQNKSEVNSEGPTSFEIFENHLLFKVDPNISITKDLEVFHPISFEVRIPKKIKYWEGENSTLFRFLYKSKQIIIIDTEHVGQIENTIRQFTPSESDISRYSLIESNYKQDSKWRVRRFNKQKRRNLIYYTGGTKLILLNIKRKNMEHYKSCISSFKVISE